MCPAPHDPCCRACPLRRGFELGELTGCNRSLYYQPVMIRNMRGTAESGSTEEVLSNPRDPYTETLLKSVPSSEPEWLAASR
jgi:Oligopeptide/dipeptide transporter, C-terminal region